MNDRKPLALRYRPQTFSQLIGQEGMVISIQNAIKLKRIPNAYLLTGIRGTGKTTTARIIAKAINCKVGFTLDDKNKDKKKYSFCSVSINSVLLV
mgnify:CR=1 FL=1